MTVGRRIKKASLRQEQKVAEAVGGRTQAASGGTRLGGGGDVRADGLRIECKLTEKDSFSLKLKELLKLQDQAYGALEEPVFQFSFLDRAGRRESYVVVKTTPEKAYGGVVIYSASALFHRGGLRSQSTRFIRFIEKNGTCRAYQILPWEDFLRSREDTAT